MRFASNLGIQQSGAPNTRNAEGHPAFDESWKQSIARIAFTGVLGDQYYGKEKTQAAEFIPLCRTAVEHDMRFLLNAASVSRAANFKLFPKVAVALAITNASPKAMEKYEEEIVGLLSTYSASQLLELALIFKNGDFGGKLGSRAQRLLGLSLTKRSPHALENMTLADREDLRRLLRLLHPKGFTTEQSIVFKYVLGDNPVPVLPRQLAMEALKSGECNQAALITDHHLPFNATKGVANSEKATWEAIRGNMSTLQLLLNMVALDKRDVLTPEILGKHLSAADISKTRLVPHDILRAIGMAYETKNASGYREVLVKFLGRLVSAPIPGMEGKNVAVVMDVSGSMAPGYNQSSIGNWALACSLATPIMAACPERSLVFFGTQARFEGDKFPYLKGVPTEAAFHNLLQVRPNGGTDMGCGLDLLLMNERNHDLVFMFTDEQENVGNVYPAWERYRKANKGTKLIVVNVSNTKWHIARDSDPTISIIQSITPLIYHQFANMEMSAVEMIAGWHQRKEAVAE